MTKINVATWKREAEAIMNVEQGWYDGDSVDDIIESMIDAINYGVEDEKEIEAFLTKCDYGRNVIEK